MTLSEYLTSNSKKPSHFADEVGVPASTITRILNGDRRPGLPLLLKILKATNGIVTPNDFAQELEAENDA